MVSECKNIGKAAYGFCRMAMIVGRRRGPGHLESRMLNGYIEDMYKDSLVMAIDLGHVNEEAVEIRLAALKMRPGCTTTTAADLRDANGSGKTWKNPSESIRRAAWQRSENF